MERTYVFSVLVVQAGKDARDARFVLSGCLGEIMEPEDFEVSPMPVSLDTRRFVAAVADVHYEPEQEDPMLWLDYVSADKRANAKALYELMMTAELDDLSDTAKFYERDGLIGEMATALGKDVALVVEAHFFLALRSVTHMKSGKPYVQRS